MYLKSLDYVEASREFYVINRKVNYTHDLCEWWTYMYVYADWYTV